MKSTILALALISGFVLICGCSSPSPVPTAAPTPSGTPSGAPTWNFDDPAYTDDAVISGKFLINGEVAHGYDRTIFIDNGTYVNASGEIIFHTKSLVDSGHVMRRGPIDGEGNFWIDGITSGDCIITYAIIYGKTTWGDRRIGLGRTLGGLFLKATITNETNYYDIEASGIYQMGTTPDGNMTFVDALANGTRFEDLPGGSYETVANLTAWLPGTG